MILDSGTSSSDIKIKDDDYKVKYSKIKMLYIGIMCLSTNCLSSIALEAGSRSSYRTISPMRPAIFNNLFLHHYNLRIKTMVGDLLAALVSTAMLIIGDTYRIPYLYLPWLVNTIKGMVFYEGPALYELAYTVLPNANLFTGLFIFITLFLCVEELCIWKDVFVNFKHCWITYNKNNKLRKNAKLMKMADKKVYNKIKESPENIVSSAIDQQNSTICFKESKNNDITRVESVTKNMKDNVSIKSCRSKSPFTKVTG